MEQDQQPAPAASVALIAVMMVLDSLFFIWAKILLPYISPTTSVFYVMVISSMIIGLVAWFQKSCIYEHFSRTGGFFCRLE